VARKLHDEDIKATYSKIVPKIVPKNAHDFLSSFLSSFDDSLTPGSSYPVDPAVYRSDLVSKVEADPLAPVRHMMEAATAAQGRSDVAGIFGQFWALVTGLVAFLLRTKVSGWSLTDG
jgi:hypothetical protein